MKCFSTFAAASMIALTGVCAQADVLNPTKVGWIRSDNPTTNSDSQNLFIVGPLGGNPTQKGRGVLEFDLSQIPDNAQIASVTLTLGIDGPDNSSTTSQLQTLELHDLDGTFAEDGVTWNNRSSSTAWTTPGGDYDSTLLSSVQADSQNTAVQRGDLLTFANSADFGAAVQDALANNTLSLLIRSAAEDSSDRGLFRFDHEAVNQDDAYPPQLNITLVPEPSSLAVIGMGSLFLMRRRRRSLA